MPVHAIDDFNGLGDLPGGAFDSEAYGVSDDGTVVVGYGSNAIGTEAFRWESNVMTGLGYLPGGGFWSIAFDVSADGAVVVGESLNGLFKFEAFRWESNVMTGLGDLPGGNFKSRATGVSADGSVVVGYGTSASGLEAFRWESSIMTGLGDLPGGTFGSWANDVSANGAVVVGYGTSASGQEAFRWESNIMTGLGDLPGGTFESVAFGVSDDGTVVVGYGNSASGKEAFRRENNIMTGLGDLAGGSFESLANGVSDDGTVVVGYGTSASGEEAFRWTQATGMQSVVDWLADAGVTVTGWSLTRAGGVNADGSVVVGYGTSASGWEAFIARVTTTTSPPTPGLIGLTSFTRSLGSTASTLNAGNFLASLPLNGNHNRPLLAHPELNSRSCTWANGDLAHYGRNNDADVALAEVGGCYDLLPQQLRLGAGIGKSYVDQDLAFNGKSDLNGEYIITEVDYQPATLPVIASITGLYGRWDANVNRGYLNAGNPDQSNGYTDIETTSVRARVDLPDAMTIKDVGITLRMSYTLNHVDVDSYTETGGSFPARFNDRSHTTQEVRFGVDAVKKLTERTRLRGLVEGVHRFDDDPDLSGQVIGLFSFSLPGTDNEQTWARIGAELEHRFRKNMVLSVSLMGSSEGEDPDVSGGLSLKMTF